MMLRTQHYGNHSIKDIFTRLKSLHGNLTKVQVSGSLSRIIIQAYGSRIWAENNPDGVGVTFAFILPILG